MVNVIYIDSSKGLDSNDGSLTTPYKTLQYVITNVLNRVTLDYEIRLLGGSYKITDTNSFSNFSSGNLVIIGNGKDTTIIQEVGLNSNSLAGSRNFNLTIAKCKYNILTTLTNANLNSPLYRINFKNVLFEYTPSNGYSVFYSGNFIEFKNCVKLTSTSSFLRTTDGVIRVIDSIGYFTSGYATYDSSWNFSGNKLNTIDNYEEVLNSGEYAWLTVSSLIYNQGNYKTYILPVPEGNPVNLIPTMTSNTSPSPFIASESSSYQSSYLAYFSMDGVLSNSSKWLASGANFPQWVSIKLDTPKTAHIVSLSCALESQTFSNWRIQGSNDNSTWEDLLIASNEVPPINNYKDYTLTTTGEFLYYRVYIEQGSGIPSLSGFRLLSKGTPMVDGYWKDISVSYPTLDNFINDGLKDLRVLTIKDSQGISPIDILTNDIKVVSYFGENLVSTKLKLKAKPLNTNQLVYTNGDISLFGVETIDSINLTSYGECKITVSFDSGTTEYAYINGVWNLVENASFGMSSSELNALNGQILSIIRNDSNTVRFNYYIVDNSYVDKIQMKVTMQGTEKIAESKDYTLTYNQSQRKLIYNISKSGTYSVNYVS